MSEVFLKMADCADKFSETLNNLLENDGDIDVNSVEELVEKYKDYTEEEYGEGTIKTYKTNAYLCVGEKGYFIDWDGISFDTEDEYKEWVSEVLAPAKECDNYDDVKLSLEIATDYLR